MDKSVMDRCGGESEVVEEKYEAVDVIYLCDNIEVGSSGDNLNEVLKRGALKLEEMLEKVGADGTVGLKIEFENIVKSDGKILTGKVVIFGTAVRFK